MRRRALRVGERLGFHGVGGRAGGRAGGRVGGWVGGTWRLVVGEGTIALMRGSPLFREEPVIGKAFDFGIAEVNSRLL